MGRSTKLIFVILLLLLITYPLFSTCFTAVSNPGSILKEVDMKDVIDVSTDVEEKDDDSSKDEEDIDNTDKEDSEKEVDDEKENPGLIINNKVSKYVYYISTTSFILIVIEVVLFALVLGYLFFTHACKNDLKDVFSNNKSTIFSFFLVTISVAHGLSFGILYLVQTLITMKF